MRNDEEDEHKNMQKWNFMFKSDAPFHNLQDRQEYIFKTEEHFPSAAAPAPSNIIYIKIHKKQFIVNLKK